MSIAVVAVGTVALPATMSLFAGQHTWYALDTTGADLPCEKCHADIYDEFLKTDAHSSLGGSTQVDNRSACYACHRTNSSITYAKGDGGGATPGDKAHAASTVACMLCHQYDAANGTNHSARDPGPHAGGFANVTGSPYDYATSTRPGGHAAHQTFVQQAINDDLGKRMEDANEACIACHTAIPVKINWTHAYSLEFNATYGLDLPPTHFNVTDWAVNGTVNVTTYGNESGGGSTTTWP